MLTHVPFDSTSGRWRRYHRRWWLLPLCFSWLCCPELLAAARALKVGVADNPPIVFKSAKGSAARGFAVEILEHVADQESWRIQYVYAPWTELLDQLNARELDLVIGIGLSEARREHYRFTQEPLIGNWGVVYRAPEVSITTLLDLKDRRVALMVDSTHSEAFRKLMSGFGVAFRPVHVPTYDKAMAAVAAGNADAAVVNQLFANANAMRYRAEITGIMFNPVYVHYATHEDGDSEIITTLDRHLRELKDVPDSLYYRSLKRWLAVSATPSIPAWLASITVALTILLSASLLGAGALRKQLRAQMHVLARRSDELRMETAQRRLAQERLALAASHDPLTRLPNRIACIESLPTFLREADGTGTTLAIYLFDIDHFKGINESLGHAAGDALLREVSSRMQQRLHYRDKLFRYSSDEFVILARSVASDSDIAALAEHLLLSLREPITFGEQFLHLSASIGISSYPADDHNPQELLRKADIAMRYAKAQGRNRHCRYVRDMVEESHSRFQLGAQLHHALGHEQLLLHCQPIVRLSDGRPIGFEALLRWLHPAQGLRLPDAFVPYAEENGIIEALGAWALANACEQAQALRARHPNLTVSVNVSARQLESRRFEATLAGALERAGLPPNALELEVTESVLLATSRDIGRVLGGLKEMGVRFAIDDFGIGYSSLAYLTRLPIDTLKIDKSFVSGLPDKARHRQIVTTILAMGHGLDLAVVAEGVETAEQLTALRDHGCDYGQGYYIGRPMPFVEFEAWLAQRPALDT